LPSLHEVLTNTEDEDKKVPDMCIEYLAAAAGLDETYARGNYSSAASIVIYARMLNANVRLFSNSCVEYVVQGTMRRRTTPMGLLLDTPEDGKEEELIHVKGMVMRG
jgi:hypothetical protein